MSYRVVTVKRKVDIDLPEGQSWTQVQYQLKPTWFGKAMRMMRALRAFFT